MVHYHPQFRAKRAHSLLCRGYLAENVGDFQAAAFFYQLGLENNPTLSWIRYWLLNNLGYFLI